MNSKITVPNPCHENWGNMTPNEKGRFCAVCSKSVYDFTTKTEEEIIGFVQLHNEKVCGRFLNSHVGSQRNFVQRKLVGFYEASQKYFAKSSLPVLAISSLLTLVGCKKKTTEDVVVDASKDTTNCREDSASNGIIMGKPILNNNAAQIDSSKQYELGEAKIVEDSTIHKMKNVVKK